MPAAAAPAAPHAPITAPRRSTGTPCSSAASETVTSTAPAAPWAVRIATSDHRPGASAQSADVTAKASRPKPKTPRAPRASAKRPPVTSSAV